MLQNIKLYFVWNAEPCGLVETCYEKNSFFNGERVAAGELAAVKSLLTVSLMIC